MLNYANLNDMEFEALCKDVMERMLGVSLRRFGPGRDHGVDLTDDVSTKSIVVQVKHYRNSTTEQLVRSLKNELPKVIELAPKQYYICCSRELSADNINALYQHFRAYMDSDRCIITQEQIDDFLKDEANRNILKKHYKLWLDSTGILEDIFSNKLFIDCEVLLDDIENQQKLFVQTEAFDRALNALENRQVLCIVGNPGVGKSITSNMLVLHYAAEGYQVRYTSDVTDLGSLKQSISRDPSAKEVILLDDCFGQAYIEMHSSQSTSLVQLIKYVKRHSSKLLILNSRITIFQEAHRRYLPLSRSLECDDFKVFLLDLDNLSDEEKAKILYNHLSFSSISNDHFDTIKKDKRYDRIVGHRNYSPRIIQYVCSPRCWRMINARDYFDFIMKHLDNPKEIWADEYDNRLEDVDRILLETIYSLTTTTVSMDLVHQCFDRRLANSMDTTLDLFDHAVKRLCQGFIKIVVKKGVRCLSMHDPSVNDFLRYSLSRNRAGLAALIQSICAVQQLRLLPEEKRIPYVAQMLREGRIDELIFPDADSRSAIIGHCILASGLCMTEYQDDFHHYLINLRYSRYLYQSSLPGKLNISQELLKPNMWSTYQMSDFFAQNDNLYRFLSYWSLGDGVTFLKDWDYLFQGEYRESYLRQSVRYLEEAVSDFCLIDASDYEYDVDIGTFIYSDPELDLNDYYFLPEASEKLDRHIQKLVYEELQSIRDELPECFYDFVDSVWLSDISVSGAQYLIEEYLSNPPGHYDPDDDDDDDDGYSPIDAIFER